MHKPDEADSSSRILIVDDDRENRRVIEVMLTADGLQVITADGGGAALALIEHESVDLIILDVMMHGMDGFEVASRVKSNTATQNIPIVMVTGLDDRAARMRGLRAGAEDFLTKPVDHAELTLRVRNLLRLKAYADAYDRYSQILEGEVDARTADLVKGRDALEQQAEVLADRTAVLRQRTSALAAALERAEFANHAKDRLLMTVSHELRTPLNAILGWADILIGRHDPTMLERALPVIRRNAIAQTLVVDQLLDVARIDTGRLQLALRPTDLWPIVLDVLEIVRPAALAKRIELKVAGDVTGRAIVLGDPVRLQQVVWNLLSNAVKFTPDGGTVRVHAQLLPERVRIEVSDDGIGITRGGLSRVFDEFFQGDDSTTREHGGLGLGLTLVQKLVELQGGMVQASSGGAAMGASFVVELPLHRGVAGSAINDAAVLPVFSALIDLAGVRVLVIDDDVDASVTTAASLEAAGASTLISGSTTGLDALLLHDVDVVVSNVHLPLHDGIVFIQGVRAMHDDIKRQVPAVALSALAREDDRRRILDAGFHQFAAKPISVDRLLRCVAAAAASSANPEKPV
jgi:signal transduction histidine kinase